MSPGFKSVGLSLLRRLRPANGGASSPAADEPPLRAELFSVSQLEHHARTLAAWHRLAPARRRAADQLLPRLAANEVALREAHALVTEAVQRGRRITPAAEWFIDNFHLIEEQIRTARRHLPRGYSRALPRLTTGPSTGIPRVYDLVLELVSHAHGRLDIEGLRAFVTAYQSVQALRLGELWAIPIMLRLALIENLRRVVSGVTAGRRDREAAGTWVERMIETATSAPARVVLVLAEMIEADPPLTNPFIAELASRLQGLGPALVFPMTWLEQRLAERGQSLEHVFQLVSQSQAADQVAIGNSIGSLRLLGATDWREFVEAMSVVERALGRDPAGVHASMDFATRDRYRHVVETIARRSALGEEAVAEAAVTLARAGSERRAHVGYYLIDAGRDALERAVQMRRTPRLRRLAQRWRLPMYVGSIVALTGLATSGLVLLAQARGLTGSPLALATLLLAIASSQLVVAVVHWTAILLAHPAILPRLDFSAGIPADLRTAVAVPTLLTDIAEVDALLEALEVRYLANRDPNLSFALLSDFRDAPREHMDADDALLQRAREGILALNARYLAAGRATPFYLLHRPRRWNPREGVWMGWERKRGKLEQFNAALRGELAPFATIVGDVEHLRGVRYVIALDSDTQLPRDAARELVATMAHPLNRPRFDATLGRVVEGYAILQPRVAITMASARRSVAPQAACNNLRRLAREGRLGPYLPGLKIRVVNVVDLMRLQPRTEHPHGLSDGDFDALFTQDRPVIFAFHAYPWLIHRLTYRRTNHGNIHVRGYKEEGTVTTPFDMTVLNELDRFHLVMDTVDRLPTTGDQGLALKVLVSAKLVEHRRYITENGQDMPEIRAWRWSRAPAYSEPSPNPGLGAGS